MEWRTIDIGTGRSIEVADAGRGDAGAIVFHSGTPGGPVLLEPLAAGAAARGLRLVTAVRPGYGASTPVPGRAVADVASDTAAILDACGVSTYVAIGHSGGGPHALACRALDPERCTAAIGIASVAPHEAVGLDWLAGMGEDNVAEFGAAVLGDPDLADFLSAVADAIRDIDAAGVAESLASLLPDVDIAYLNAGAGEFFAAMLRSGVSNGIAGWHDDDLAFVRPWGFDVAGLTNVSIWQGSDDLMVPYAHGRWLARTIPGCTAHLLEGEGHLSVLLGRLDAILDEAAALAS